MYRGATLSLGPLTLPLTWLFIACSLIIGYLLFFFMMKEKKDARKEISSLLANAILIFVGGWKISPLFFKFQAVRESPLLILYMPGGVGGVLLGLAAGTLYFVLAVRKKKVPAGRFIIPLGAGLGIALLLGLITNLVVLQKTPRAPRGGAEELLADVEEGLLPGMLAPKVVLEDIHGEFYALSNYDGSVVFLNFWATWCPPCRAEIPEMVRFYNEYSEKNIQILAVNLFQSEQGKESVLQFVERYGITFPVLLDEEGLAANRYEIDSVPTTYVIGPNGLITAKKTGTVSASWMARQVNAAFPSKE